MQHPVQEGGETHCNLSPHSSTTFLTVGQVSSERCEGDGVCAQKGHRSSCQWFQPSPHPLLLSLMSKMGLTLDHLSSHDAGVSVNCWYSVSVEVKLRTGLELDRGHKAYLEFAYLGIGAICNLIPG